MSAKADPRRWRTALFVPADRPEMLSKVQARGADAIVVDLEDAIAPGVKDEAREGLASELAAGTLGGPAAVLVRVNAWGEGCEQDLRSLRSSEVEAIVLPKAGDAAQVDGAIREIRRCWPDRRVGLMPQVESVDGILATPDLLRIDGVVAIAFGGEDFCVDLGVSRSDDSLELLFPRAQLGLAARAANIPAIDTVYTAIDDEDGLVIEARIARQLGFGGKLLIHPRQVEPVRRVFTPDARSVDWARRVLAAMEGADERVGVSVVDGKMVDAPVVAQAERILARGT